MMAEFPPGDWRPAPDPVDTPVGVDVWRCSLQGSSRHGRGAWAMISDDERERARRFALEAQCWRFAIARASLRAVLARYVGRPPGSLLFAYGEKGKPSVLPSSPDAEPPPSFNLSHAGDLALIAVAPPRLAVGIDVETIDAGVDVMNVAARFFSAREGAELAALRGAALRAAFFGCWTRKESFVKCTGLGLALPLGQFDVTVTPPGSAALIADRTGHSTPAWRLFDVPVEAPYVAAVTVAGAYQPVRLFQLDADLVGPAIGAD